MSDILMALHILPQEFAHELCDFKLICAYRILHCGLLYIDHVTVCYPFHGGMEAFTADMFMLLNYYYDFKTN